jgi:hypothetical protein
LEVNLGSWTIRWLQAVVDVDPALISRSNENKIKSPMSIQ